MCFLLGRASARLVERLTSSVAPRLFSETGR